jgi:hypothetical protein
MEKQKYCISGTKEYHDLYNKMYVVKRKDYIYERIKCDECDKYFVRNNKSAHLNTNFHKMTVMKKKYDYMQQKIDSLKGLVNNIEN